MPAAPAPQQFKKHPLPFLLMNVLAGAPSLVKGAFNGDFLLVPPPSADDVDANGGSVVRAVIAPFGVRNAGTADTVAATDVQLVYKAEGGREVVLANLNPAVLVQGAITFMQPAMTPLLSPNDQGIFLRVTGAIAGLLIDASGTYADLRGPQRTTVDVNVVSPAAPQTVAEGTEEGAVLYNTFIAAGFGIANFDTVAHTFHIFLDNGTDTIELTNTAVPQSIPAGFAFPLPLAGSAAGQAIPALAEGWSLKVSLGEAVVTKAPRVFTGYVSTNEGPARNDQAGAY